MMAKRCWYWLTVAAGLIMAGLGETPGPGGVLFFGAGSSPAGSIF